MPRAVVEDKSRMSLPIRAKNRAESARLSAGASGQRVLDLLENPPAPNKRLRAAAKALRVTGPSTP